ncbi:Tyrosine--tRNA ligase, mitochondrial [Gryllus bimaculatus]|nr:Tyrosine--tRNA ligase, mitochondrial [Gryllus bimaculatus]
MSFGCVNRLSRRCFVITPVRHYYKNVLQLYERGLYQDLFPSNASNEIADLLKTPQCVYAGFDPTADSLHVGNLLILMGLLHWQRAGHHVIALVGSATAAIGDPTGRSTSRPTLAPALLQENAAGLRANIQQVFDNHRKYFWTSSRPLGRFTLAELCYQAFQAYDWLHLYRAHGCRFQLGGADQMGNINTGHELISRAEDARVYGLTMPLVTTEEGDKLGKSAGNAVWLSAARTSPFQLYQFLLRTQDADAGRLLRLLTLEAEAEVRALLDAPAERRLPQRRLAQRVTTLVHGERGLAEARATSDALYGGSIEALARLSPGDAVAALRGAALRRLPLRADVTALELALAAGCFASEEDARRVMAAGGFYLNHQRVREPGEVLTRAVHILPNNLSLVRVGKKNYYVVEWLA